MSTSETDEKLKQILGASPKNHQSCVADCRSAYEQNVSDCRGSGSTLQNCLNNARDMLESCINGCPNGIVRERAADIIRIIVGDD
jgi:hypothetical protein